MSELIAKFPDLIDSTLRGDFVDCGHKFELSRLYGLQSLGGSVHLVAGGAFARGCEVIRKEFYLNGASEWDAIVAGVLAAFEHYGAFEPEDKYKTKSAERVAYALVEYFTEYPLATDQLQPYFGKEGNPAIEFSFSFPLETKHPVTGNPLLYGGRFDMVGEYLSNLWVVDEKTTTRLGPQWLKSFTLRGQLIGYCYAAQMFDLPVNGFIVRGLSFLKDYYGHAEVIEVVPQYRLDDWRQQLEYDVQDMVRKWEQQHFGKAYGNACNNYGGCTFKHLCDKEQWQDWWQQHFEISYWNPLERVDEKKDEQVLHLFTS